MIRREFTFRTFSCRQFAPARWTRLLLKSLGPGVITGAADDDPSGIATYSVAGAQLGTKLLWTALLTWPLMAAVQMMCARIGKVTGQGLAGNFKQRFPSWLLRVFIMALLAANTINIAADLAGMADAAEMLSGVNSHLFVVVFALLISWATVRLHYHQIANVLKWLVLVLFAYPITAFVVGADWSRVLRRYLWCRRCRIPEMNGRCWWRFSAPRSVHICFSGRRVKKLKRKRRQVRIRLLNEEEQRSKNLS